MTDTIADGLVVSLAYVLKVDGQEVDRAERDDPFEYLHGADNIVPGLEAALTGRRVGDAFKVSVPPADGYGEYDEGEIEELSRGELPGAEKLEPGTVVQLEDEDGYIYMATVARVTPSSVVLDFNPPLAGKTLDYDVEVLAIRPATDDEIAHGHVHGDAFDDYDDEYDDYEEDEDEE
ncbi:MAG: FKBP-type peptidyl-prolyl cis-trans isomerase [Aggregatilineales bacterium]